ncbi:MAG: hypothetical protein AWU55_1669 [Halomonadaceae bacterium T82-2]|nr:MAG: hypothetical protein AWU55_1669 [Halomonadaceae bacterium T82-2]
MSRICRRGVIFVGSDGGLDEPNDGFEFYSIVYRLAL